MLSEEQANDMMEIVFQLECRRCYYGYQYDEVMLNHLYDLHKLRDVEIYSEMFDYLFLFNDGSCRKLMEMNDA